MHHPFRKYPSRRACILLSLALLVAGLLIKRHALDLSDALQSSDRGRYVRPSSVDDCSDVPPLPLSSRGFARACCTIYPQVFGKYRPAETPGLVSLLQSGDRYLRPWSYPRSFFEAGASSDRHYFFRHAFSATETVYVVTPDLSAFVERFLRLPPTARVTLVTGSEDIGAPFEVFHPVNRTDYFDYNMAALWPRGQPVGMRAFIRDPRLVMWYAQNYDLVGCNVYTCSDVDPSRPSDAALLAKVRPLPIGLDLHSLSEKVRGRRGDSETVEALVCQQRQDLAKALASAGGRPFGERRLTVHAEFDCAFPSPKGRALRERSRGELCRLLERHKQDGRFSFAPAAPRPSHSSNSKSLRVGRMAFWSRVAACAFALAPAGYGTDTHRVWEVLQMRTVPVVLASPLDALYSDFPVVVVQRWADVFAPGSLERFRDEVAAKWGRDPFSKQVLHRLTTDHWVRRVNSSRVLGLPPSWGGET